MERLGVGLSMPDESEEQIMANWTLEGEIKDLRKQIQTLNVYFIPFVKLLEENVRVNKELNSNMRQLVEQLRRK